MLRITKYWLVSTRGRVMGTLLWIRIRSWLLTMTVIRICITTHWMVITRGMMTSLDVMISNVVLTVVFLCLVMIHIGGYSTIKEIFTNESGGQAIGMEIRAQAFSFAT